VPEGVKVELRRALTGCANFRDMKMSAPSPRTAISAQIFFHEIAHFELHSPKARNGKRRKPRYIEEYEAERWSIEKMRECGLAVPTKVVYRCKKHIRFAIYKALRRGLRHVDRGVARWSGIDMEYVVDWEQHNKSK